MNLFFGLFPNFICWVLWQKWHVLLFLSVLAGGGGMVDDQHWEDRHSTFHSASAHEEVIVYCWSREGESTIDMERINNQHVNCQSPPCQSSICHPRINNRRSPLDCWSSPCRSLICPPSPHEQHKNCSR